MGLRGQQLESLMIRMIRFFKTSSSSSEGLSREIIKIKYRIYKLKRIDKKLFIEIKKYNFAFILINFKFVYLLLRNLI